MATFFNRDTKGDMDLIHSTVRNHPEVERIVVRTERDILLHYTVRTGLDTFTVSLTGYNEENPSASTARLRELLKHAIADVASHRLRNYHRNPALQSERLEQYQYDRGSYSGVADYDWPQGWDAELNRMFSERDVWFHV